jgi:hypothetical protein
MRFSPKNFFGLTMAGPRPVPRECFKFATEIPSVMPSTFNDILRDLDTGKIQVGEVEEIAELLNRALPTDGEEIPFEDKAELMAFSIGEQNPGSEAGWGGYFGPRLVMYDNEGHSIETPSRELVTRDMVEYWCNRIPEVQHAFLVARYAGLVWDLPKYLWGEKQDHALRGPYIDAMLQAVENNLHKRKTFAVLAIKQAVNIVTAFNDSKFFDRVKALILAFEAQWGAPDKPGLWYFSYEILSGNKKLIASAEEMSAVISRLEDRLEQLKTGVGNPPKPNPWFAEDAAKQLADYYRKIGDKQSVRRVLLSVGQAYEPIFATVAPMQVYGWLEKLQELYRRWDLHDDADAVLKRLREIGEGRSEGMTTTRGTIEIPKDKMDALIEALLSGDQDRIFGQVFGYFIPNREEVANQLREMAKNAPMHAMFPIALTGIKGKTSAVIGSLENDLEGRILLQISQSLEFHALFLHSVLEEGLKRGLITTGSILEFLAKSASIDPERFPLIKRALDAYFEADYVVFVHLIIPQIEEAVRNTVELTGMPVLKYKDSIYNLRTLDDILNEDTFKDLLGADTQTYAKILLTDRRGWNLRNEVCHGIVPLRMFNVVMADRLLHSLFLFGLIRREEK